MCPNEPAASGVVLVFPVHTHDSSISANAYIKRCSRCHGKRKRNKFPAGVHTAVGEGAKMTAQKNPKS